jgi:hypothetical protein
MATYTKYEQFVEDLVGKVHDLFGTAGSDSDTMKVALSNTAPSASGDAILTDASEISAGNGYTAGGTSVQNVGTRSGGTITCTGTKVVFTASGGAIAQFRYVILYNDTPTSPVDPLVAYWDHGSAVDLADGETFTIKFNNGDPTGTIFTLA